MADKFFIAKGPNYKLAWALIKEATSLKNKIHSLYPKAKADYERMKSFSDSADYPIAECYMPYHAYDEINSLAELARELREKGEALLEWLDKRSWFEVTENGFTFEKTEVSQKQKDFFKEQREKYSSLMDKYYPKENK